MVGEEDFRSGGGGLLEWWGRGTSGVVVGDFWSGGGGGLQEWWLACTEWFAGGTNESFSCS